MNGKFMIAQVGNFQNYLLSSPQGLPFMRGILFFGHDIVNITLKLILIKEEEELRRWRQSAYV
jgi:hypothetical protein